MRRLFFGMLGTETNTFSAIPTGWSIWRNTLLNRRNADGAQTELRGAVFRPLHEAMASRGWTLAAGLQAADQVGHQRRVGLDFGQRRKPGGRVAGLDRLRLAVADLLDDEVVTGLAQALLGAEVVDDQRGAHPRRFGDRAQPDAEPVLAELFDRRIADPGGGGQVG